MFWYGTYVSSLLKLPQTGVAFDRWSFSFASVHHPTMLFYVHRDIVTKEFPKGKKTYKAGDEFAPPSSDAKSLIGIG